MDKAGGGPLSKIILSGKGNYTSRWTKREGGHYQQSDQVGRGITLADGQSGRGGHYQQSDQAGRGTTLSGGQSGRGGHYQQSPGAFFITGPGGRRGSQFN